MRWLVASAALAAGLVLVGCGDGTGEPPPAANQTTAASPTGLVSPAPGTTATGAPITVISPAFGDGEPIPARYSCRGDNAPPPLSWTQIPPSTVSLALVLDDPDAVGGLFIHWVVTDIPPTTDGSAEEGSPNGGRVNANSSGDRAYLGPCPPAGTGVHHYRFTIYALAKRVDLPEPTPARQAVDAIAKASIGQGRLVGTFTG